MKKNIWIFGTVAGLISTIWIFIMIGTGVDCSKLQNGELFGYTTMIIAFSMIFVGVKNNRDKLNNGVITFGTAFKMGLLMTLVASTIYVVVWAIDYNFFVPDFADKYADAMLQMAKEKGLSQLEIDKQTAQMVEFKNRYKNPIFFTLITYAEIIPVGLILSLISAFILKRKIPKSEQPA
jgi:hypothetical protein